MPAITPSVAVHDIDEGVQFAIRFGQALGNFGQILFGSAHVAAQSHTGSRELSHNTIILSYHSLKTIQSFFCLHKALVGPIEFSVHPGVHAGLILDQKFNCLFDVHVNLACYVAVFDSQSRLLPVASNPLNQDVA
jgi:hypothetical protein